MTRDLLDHPTISARYFFPRSDAVEPPWWVESDGTRLRCFRSKSKAANAPLLLHFHGNGEVVRDWSEEFGPAANESGIDCALAEYRGYGGSEGTPQLGTMLDDAVAIARATDVDPSRLVVYGRSVGSIFALHVAATLKVAGLVIESGIADVSERLRLRMRPAELGTTPEELTSVIDAHLNHQRKIESITAPVLIFHAEGDDLVPPEHARKLARWAGERATLRVFDRGDHNSIHAFNGKVIADETFAFTHRCAIRNASPNDTAVS